MRRELWTAVKVAFERVSDLPPEEASAVLDRDLADAPEVRAEVDALLRAHRGAGSFLDSPLPGLDARLADAIRDPLIGTHVGPYQIVREIDRGGMGAVYEASRADAEYTKRVAVKVLGAGLVAGPMLERFRTERQILASLDHPNIAHLFDAGTTADGRPYFVMELVDGLPIDEYCSRCALGLADRLRLLATVGAAVHHAHQHLVVHRDIKPTNVLVTPDGAPKLLDFGIAKLLGDSPAATGAVTVDVLPMTPRYASPEQVRGEPVTTATDVYALGVLLYELLTGQPPYRLATGQAHELGEAICAQEPAPPSAAAPNVARALRGDLDTIVLKALQKDPRRRYASARALADDLERHLAGLPVLARPDTMWYHVGKFLRRHRVPVALAGVAAILVVVAFAVTAIQYRVAERERARSERRFAEVRQLANSLIFDVHDSISDLPGSTATRERLIKMAAHYLDVLAGEAAGDAGLSRELAVAYERLAGIQGAAGGANLGQEAAAVETRKKAIVLREAVVASSASDDRDSLGLAQSLGRLAMLLQDDDSAAALRTARRAAELVEALPRPLTSALVYFALGSAYVATGDFDTAAKAFARNVEIHEAALQQNPADRTARWNLRLTQKRLGAVLAMNNRFGEALATYRRALAIEESEAAENPLSVTARRDVSVTISDIGWVLGRSGDKPGALAAYRRALETRQALAEADPANADISLILSNSHLAVADLLGQLKSWREAEAHIRKALALRERLARQDPKSLSLAQRVAEPYTALGHLALAEGRYRQAVQEHLRALDVSSRLAAKNPTHRQFQFDVGLSHSNLGQSYRKEAERAGTTAERCAVLGTAQRHLEAVVDLWRGMNDEGRLLARETGMLEAAVNNLAENSADLDRLRKSGGCSTRSRAAAEVAPLAAEVQRLS